jgi:hypothetical protein
VQLVEIDAELADRMDDDRQGQGGDVGIEEAVEAATDVSVHSGVDSVVHNRVGAYQDIHRWLTIGLPYYGPLSAIPTAQDAPCHW